MSIADEVEPLPGYETADPPAVETALQSAEISGEVQEVEPLPGDETADPPAVETALQSAEISGDVQEVEPLPGDETADPPAVETAFQSAEISGDVQEVEPPVISASPSLPTEISWAVEGAKGDEQSPKQSESSKQAPSVSEGDLIAVASTDEREKDRSTPPVPRVRIEDTIDEGLLLELREAFVLGMHPGDRNSIDSRKLLRVLRSLGIATSPSEHAELLSAADPSGSGQIPWQVFLALGSTLAVGRKDPKIEEADLLQAFRRVDKAGAGTIRVCEFRKAATQVEQEQADRSDLWKVIKDEEVHGEVNYEEFVRRHVAERRWHKSYLGPGGLLTAPS